MSLRSGRNYLKEVTTTQQNEASGEEQTEGVDQATERKEPPQASDAKSQSSRASSRRSQRSSSAVSSSTVSSATKAYAKAKAAWVQLAYAKREVDVMRQRADLEASMLKQKANFDTCLHLLKFQRAAAAAEAEVTAYEEAKVEGGELHQSPDVEEEPFSAVQRTSEYVQQQSELVLQELPSKHVAGESYERKINKLEIPDAKPATSHGILSNTQPIYKDMKKELTMCTYPSETYPHSTPKHTPNPEKEDLPEPKGAQDFARYLIRREMVSAGLLQFDDKPENYWSWKASFISDLNLSGREELDLMTKWLGAESSEQGKENSCSACPQSRSRYRYGLATS